ncbi:hypothetical protein [Afifella aestuarii]|uniref:hypothetical protein n=1 Tax=Afifella aestuarii TaxID=1909496 RepID=UPI000FE3017B|nr:hypothetical protein [Afifella aestuarii]
MNDNAVLDLLNRAFGGPKQMLVTKARRPRRVVMAKSRAEDAPAPMSVDEAKARLSRACGHGNITGTDALKIEKAVESHGAVPADVANYLRGIS